ncbi:extracellular solute-binding protein [Paenibacillus endoradicis]|uniref:extracellular solute-binding protein n=1 Tax=Paenibacillus endoradicis TaxID=2972487 RepID=UPI002158ECEE|nr:extracellular solute-binding protein [Paenibacillus endoradicis]MCR8657143.1 extracellular solute-binding protein [Paenibacillus endoradicis]
MKNSRTVILAMILVLTLVLSACGNNTSTNSNSPNNGTNSSANTGETAKPYEGQTLVVGVWGGPHEKVIDKYIRGPLEALGAEVELVLGGTGDRTALLYAEKSNPSMDIAFLNIYESKQAIEDGVAQDVDPSVPNLANSYEIAQSWGYGSSIMALGIAYNPESVTEPIDSWDDLWRDELKGEISVSTFPGFEAESFLAIAGLAFGKTEADLEDNIAKVEELGGLAMTHYNLDELALEINAGTVSAAPVFNYQANLLKEAGASIEFVYPSNPGPILAKNTMVISKNSKNTELAKEFINLMLSPEAQAELAALGFYGPVNTTAVLDEELASKVLYGQEAVDSMITLDWSTIIDQRSAATNLWNQKILNN